MLFPLEFIRDLGKPEVGVEVSRWVKSRRASKRKAARALQRRWTRKGFTSRRREIRRGWGGQAPRDGVIRTDALQAAGSIKPR